MSQQDVGGIRLLADGEIEGRICCCCASEGSLKSFLRVSPS